MLKDEDASICSIDYALNSILHPFQLSCHLYPK